MISFIQVLSNFNREAFYTLTAFDQGFDNENDPGLALATLSSSDHLILTYGTFGLMAAFFNEGNVKIH